MSEKIVEIKTFSEDMLLFVSKLTRQLTNQQKSTSEDAFREILEAPNSHLLVIHDDTGAPAGMTTVGIYRTPTGCKAWIEDVVVDNDARGKGYGKKIVEHAIEFIRKKGASTISLTSNPTRLAANKLYQTLGFEKYETNVYRIRYLQSHHC